MRGARAASCGGAAEAFLGSPAADALGVEVGDTLPWPSGSPATTPPRSVRPRGISSSRSAAAQRRSSASAGSPTRCCPTSCSRRSGCSSPGRWRRRSPARSTIRPSSVTSIWSTAFVEVVLADCAFTYRYFSIQTEDDAAARRVVDDLTAAFQAENEGVPEVASFRRRGLPRDPHLCGGRARADRPGAVARHRGVAHLRVGSGGVHRRARRAPGGAVGAPSEARHRRVAFPRRGREPPHWSARRRAGRGRGGRAARRSAGGLARVRARADRQCPGHRTRRASTCPSTWRWSVLGSLAVVLLLGVLCVGAVASGPVASTTGSPEPRARAPRSDRPRPAPPVRVVPPRGARAPALCWPGPQPLWSSCSPAACSAPTSTRCLGSPERAMDGPTTRPSSWGSATAVPTSTPSTRKLDQPSVETMGSGVAGVGDDRR